MNYKESVINQNLVKWGLPITAPAPNNWRKIIACFMNKISSLAGVYKL